MSAPAKVEVFRITKSENKNMVIYEIELEEENPDHVKNLKGYWVMNQTDGHIEDINWIERKMSYGIKIEKQTETEIFFHIVALPKQKLHIYKVNGEWKCETDVDGVAAIIESIFIDVTTVILIKPTIHSITLTAKAVDDGREVKKVFVP